MFSRQGYIMKNINIKAILILVSSISLFMPSVIFAEGNPTITSVTPTTIYYSDEVDIIGSNFGDSGIVFLAPPDDSSQGQVVISWTDTKIRVRVNNAHLGDIKLIVGAWNNSGGKDYSDPSPIITIGGSCIADIWSPSDWSECSIDGFKTREYIKTFDCDVVDSPKPDSPPSPPQACTYIPPIQKNPYVCYPNCDVVSICVNDSCSQPSYKKAKAGDKISLIGFDLDLTKTVTVANTQIDNWNIKNEIFEFFLPDTIKNGGAFVNLYGSEGGLIASGTLTIYLQSTLPPPQPTCTADTWTCGSWGECSLSGIQNRSCSKTLDCSSVETAPPTTSQYCEAPNRPQQQIPQDSSGVILNQSTIIKSTVKLICPVDAKRASQGSGTVIDSSGTILTNKHVIVGTLGCLVGFINEFNDEPYFGERHIADILKMSSNQDIAVLKIRNPQNKNLPSVDITKGSGKFRLGTKVSTFGFPAQFGTKITYTSGDFSGTDGSYLKTTAILEYGNSGGGAYLKDGTFIGVPSAVVSGELNALGYILSINTINAWLGNASVVSDSTNNKYSRVSILEDIDLKTLDSLKLFIPETDASGNLTAPVISATTQKDTEESQLNQTQEESTVIELADTNQDEPEKEQENKVSWLKRFFLWITDIFNF